VFERYSECARMAIFMARFSAGDVGSPQMDTEDLLFGVFSVDENLIRRSGSDLTLEKVTSDLSRWRSSATPIKSSADLPLSSEFEAVLSRVEPFADETGCREIRTEHLLLAMVLESACHAAVALTGSGVDVETIRALANETHGEGRQPCNNEAFSKLFPPDF
jgi:ATP-dependent Clp protease ATP-binding subunit ClpA